MSSPLRRRIRITKPCLLDFRIVRWSTVPKNNDIGLGIVSLVHTYLDHYLEKLVLPCILTSVWAFRPSTCQIRIWLSISNSVRCWLATCWAVHFSGWTRLWRKWWKSGLTDIQWYAGSRSLCTLFMSSIAKFTLVSISSHRWYCVLLDCHHNHSLNILHAPRL